MYLAAVADTFEWNEGDCAQIVKIFGNDPEGHKHYSPSICIRQHEITGDPDLKRISTRFIEGQNLTMFMGRRRSTRLTNVFFKKTREPRPLRGAALHELQLRPHPHDPKNHSSDGRGRLRSRLVAGRNRSAGRLGG